MLRGVCRGLGFPPVRLDSSASWLSRRGWLTVQPKAFLASPIMCTGFSSTTCRGQVSFHGSQAGEKDVVPSILRALMKKREILLRREDAQTSQEVAKTLADLDTLRTVWLEWDNMLETKRTLLNLTDPNVEPNQDLREMADEDATRLEEPIEEKRAQLVRALLPVDETNNQSAIIEIRPGVGGDESAVFTGEVARMYTRLCEGWPEGFKVEELSSTPLDVSTNAGPRPDAFREVILSVQGRGAYDLLRHEAGVHRVQRIPVTVSTPKLQTSAIAVIVLPMVEESRGSSKGKELDIVDPKDVKEEVMRSRGAGGQHVNKTESAIRLTHLPTGISVSMQDSRSQQQNRTKAWQILRARLLDRKLREDEANERSVRRSQVASTDRGDRIRTYNFPQDRVTDHRVPVSMNNISYLMEGDSESWEYLLEALHRHFESIALRALKEQVKQDLVQLAKESS